MALTSSRILWDEADDRGFKKFFYDPSWEYSDTFLKQKKKELKRLFPQEYPSTPEEAFLTSGDLYFDKFSLKYYNENTRDPIGFQFST